MFAQLFAFVILLLLLGKFAFKPLVKVVEDRQEYIEKQIENAERQRVEAEKLQAEHRQEMIQAREEALNIVERARKQSEKQATEILQAATDEAKRIKDSAKLEITKEKNEAMAELRNEIGSLSLMLASKIIDKDMDEQAHVALIDSYLDEVGKSLWCRWQLLLVMPRPCLQ